MECFVSTHELLVIACIVEVIVLVKDMGGQSTFCVTDWFFMHS